MNMVIKCLLAALWLLAVPWAAGGVVLCKSKKSSMGMNLLAGYLMMFSFAEILALAAIWAKLPLHVLKYSLAAVMASAAVLGIVLALVKRNGFTGNGEKTGKMSFYFVVAAILILLQLVAASFLAHMDADDAFYVATATTSVHTDTVFSINPYTGYSYTRLPSRYVLSPFPIFLAVISSLVGLHPAIVAHVIFPVVFIFMAYLVLYQYAKRWFPEDEHARGIFMIFCAVLIWFSAYSVYNSENFQMIRIWQGKALLASFVLPAIFLQAKECMETNRMCGAWVTLFLMMTSACLVSGMGIMLAPIMLGLMTLLYAVKDRNWGNIKRAVICCLPNVICAAAYVIIR